MPIPCTSCNSTGKRPSGVECPICEGKGQRLRADERKTEKKIPVFFKALRKLGTISKACKASKVSYTSIRLRMKDNPQFEEEVLECLDEFSDLLEEEAIRRAVTGEPKKIFRGSEVVDTEYTKSDAILRVLLQGYKPNKYKATPAGRPKVEETDDKKSLSDKELEKLVEKGKVVELSTGTGGK